VEKSLYNMKAEKIQRQVKQGDYETAAKICDGIDWTQISSVRMLSLVSSVYEHVGQYERAIDILVQAYEEAPVGRRFLYKLTELAIAAGNIKEAEEYYKNYLQEAPDDNQRYILRYEIAEAKGEPLDKKITILEAYKRNEFDEKWSCRLAELYDQLGNGTMCVKICDELILWFGVGPYVDRALELKEKYQPLTAAQLDHRDNKAFYEDNLRKVQEQSQSAEAYSASARKEEQEELPKVTLSGPEMGVPIASFDQSAFLPDEEPPTDSYLDQTRRVNGLDDLSKTRIFEKIPDGIEEQLFKTVYAPEQTQAIPTISEQEEVIPQTIPTDDGEQLTFNFAMDDDKGEPLPGINLTSDAEPEKYFDTLCYVSGDSPDVAMEQAVALIENGHRIMRTDMKGIAKISASKLNQRGLISSLESLAGRDIIVLGASGLSEAIITEIKKVNSGLETGKIIILADSPSGIISIKERMTSNKVGSAYDFSVEHTVREEIPMEKEFATPAEPEVQEEEPTFNFALEKEYDAPQMDFSEDIPAEEGDTVEAEPVIAISPEPAPAPVVEPVPEPKVEAAEPAPVEEENEFGFSMEEVENRTPLHASLDESENHSATKHEHHHEHQREEKKDVEKKEEPKTVEAAKAPESYNEDGGVTPEEFVKYIYDYMKKIDCVPEEGGEEDMLDYAIMLAERGEYLDEVLAEEVTEEAADNAESHSLGNMFHSRYDKDGCLILRAKHFN